MGAMSSNSSSEHIALLCYCFGSGLTVQTLSFKEPNSIEFIHFNTKCCIRAKLNLMLKIPTKHTSLLCLKD